ncbi:MAG TPA: hypothetical protein VJN71_02250 [Nitrososphaerales archaeon]|nr:hypothetical protein [Nitrososphaerales archaeon]
MGPFGRVSRLLLGGFLLLLALPFYFSVGRVIELFGSTYSSDYASIFLTLSIAFGFLALYLVIHRVSMSYFRNINKYVGAIIANSPPLAVFIISAVSGFGSGVIAVFTYLGIAMLLAGWREDQGCEVMSPANAIFRRQTHFACIVFSPIDWAESKIKTRSKRMDKASFLGPQVRA